MWLLAIIHIAGDTFPSFSFVWSLRVTASPRATYSTNREDKIKLIMWRHSTEWQHSVTVLWQSVTPAAGRWWCWGCHCKNTAVDHYWSPEVGLHKEALCHAGTVSTVTASHTRAICPFCILSPSMSSRLALRRAGWVWKPSANTLATPESLCRNSWRKTYWKQYSLLFLF